MELNTKYQIFELNIEYLNLIFDIEYCPSASVRQDFHRFWSDMEFGADWDSLGVFRFVRVRILNLFS